MSRSNKDVGGYRGRRTVTDILRLIAIVLAVIVVLSVAGLIYLQRYLVYTDEGPKLELPPFLQSLRGEYRAEEPGGSASLPDPGSLSIDIGPAGSQSEPQPQPPEESAGFALALPVSDVLNGTAAEKLSQAGAEAVILEMKEPSGKLAWLSGQAMAGRARANSTQAANDALKQWNEGAVYTIARVCCFRDDSAPYYHNSLALRRGNGNWKDELGLRWLSPAQEKNQAYIAGLCGELAALGFDEIVLEQFGFPTQGSLDKITRGKSYDASQFTAQLEELLIQVQGAVAPYGTKISLRMERDTLAGAESSSGLTPQLAEQYAYRIWVAEDGLLPAPRDLLEQAGITGGADRLVSIAAVRTEGSPVVQAVLPAA